MRIQERSPVFLPVGVLCLERYEAVVFACYVIKNIGAILFFKPLLCGSCMYKQGGMYPGRSAVELSLLCSR